MRVTGEGKMDPKNPKQFGQGLSAEIPELPALQGLAA